MIFELQAATKSSEFVCDVFSRHSDVGNFDGFGEDVSTHCFIHI